MIKWTSKYLFADSSITLKNTNYLRAFKALFYIIKCTLKICHLNTTFSIKVVCFVCLLH